MKHENESKARFEKSIMDTESKLKKGYVYSLERQTTRVGKIV